MKSPIPEGINCEDVVISPRLRFTWHSATSGREAAVFLHISAKSAVGDADGSKFWGSQAAEPICSLIKS